MLEKINYKIRRLRKERKMTLQQLADETGFTKGYLSRIENSNISPRLPTLQKISRALELDISVFFEEHRKKLAREHHVDFVKADNQHNTETIESSAAYSYQPLVHSFSGKHMSPYLLLVSQGKTEKFTHDSEEMLYVVSGSVRFVHKGVEFNMSTGDSIYFDSRYEHRLFNDSEETAVLLNVVYDYRRF